MIRVARPQDAEAIERAHTRARLDAYRDFVDLQWLLEEDPALRSAEWTRRLTADSAVTTFVWDQGGQVVGFASAGEDGCLWALYVEPAAQGAGVGTALLERACEHIRAAGRSEAELWVLSGNERARRFYEEQGWLADPESETMDPTWRVPTIRYWRSL